MTYRLIKSTPWGPITDEIVTEPQQGDDVIFCGYEATSVDTITAALREAITACTRRGEEMLDRGASDIAFDQFIAIRHLVAKIDELTIAARAPVVIPERLDNDQSRLYARIIVAERQIAISEVRMAVARRRI